MANPLIAIVGSANEKARKVPYEPELKNLEQVREACVELGRELANKGYRIMVYSSLPDYIEADVVKGYVDSDRVKSGKAESESIQVRYPSSKDGPAFDEQQTHRKLFDFRGDSSGDWQVSFYTSLKDADGIILLGGGNSAFITGLVAQMYRIPLVSVAIFGGSAQTVWEISATKTLATEAERSWMNQPNWTPKQSAEQMVTALTNQRVRLEQKRKADSDAAGEAEREAGRRKNVRTALMFALLIATAALMLTGVTWATSSPLSFAAVFLAATLFAGTLGGVTRDLFGAVSNREEYVAKQGAAAAAGLGAVAGFFSALAFYYSLKVGHPEDTIGKAVPSGAELLLISVLMISFTAGLATEKVLNKWRDEGTYTPPKVPADHEKGGGKD